MAVSAKDVKALRERTGAAMMDCKAALEEAGGEMDKAVEVLRVRGQASAAKRSGRSTDEGLLASYIHANGRVGVLVEVLCETDFVARNEDFQEFAREVAIHIAGSPAPPRYVSADEIPEDERAAERGVLEAKAREIALLEQEHVRSDRYEGKTIEQLRAELASKTGENVRVGRFARFRIGED